MFKIESYITPIILSYVDKYIKNFRLEDSQVSLWGGDASFHNLDLRLEVLEQELQLPVSFVSGHIRELLIHVPWTKLASEPITITINTIECILKLKAQDQSGLSDLPEGLKEQHKKDNRHSVGEAPSGYVASLINKIVNNIRIYCNNMILKFVEEDIVLSMNVKHFKFESADEKWQPTFIDLITNEVILRKIICVNDLTICLDKRNSAGKIEIYQEPILYKCSMTMHLLKKYNVPMSKSSLNRLDIYCSTLEFGLSEQQIPMLVRLFFMLMALEGTKSNFNDDDPNNRRPSQFEENNETNDSWTNWAWSYIPAVLTSYIPDDESTSQTLGKQGHILHLGFYINKASVTFKVVGSRKDKSFKYQKKNRYMPILTLELQGIFYEKIACDYWWNNMTFGISEIFLSPLGYCPCGVLEYKADTNPNPYLSIGSLCDNYKSNSLFDEQDFGNKNEYRFYNTSWDFHMFTYPDSVLLEKTPAMVYDYIHEIVVPEDFNYEQLSDFKGNYEDSNLPERKYTRIFCSPLNIRICSGLYHRMSCFIMAATNYEYISSISAESAEMKKFTFTEEYVDAVSKYIPMETLEVKLFAPVIELELGDHLYFVPKPGRMYKKHQKKVDSKMLIQINEEENPKIQINFQCLTLLSKSPLYKNKFVNMTSQMSEPPKKLFESCYKQLQIKIMDINGLLILQSKSPTTLLKPFNISINSKQIINPSDWENPDIPYSLVTVESEILNINGTKAEIMIVYEIIYRLLQFKMDAESMLKNSTLLEDTMNNNELPCMDFFIEDIRLKKVVTSSTISMDVSIGNIKALVFKESKIDLTTIHDHSKTQPIVVLSGPEKSSLNLPGEQSLLVATIQYPICPDNQIHPAILNYFVNKIVVCCNSLLFKWLLYTPTINSKYKIATNILDGSYNSSDSNLTLESNINLTRSSQVNSIYSSSDKEKSIIKKNKVVKEQHLRMQDKIYIFLRKWFKVWNSMYFCGNFSHCTIYFSMKTFEVDESLDIATSSSASDKNEKLDTDTLVITFPHIINQCFQKQDIAKHLLQLPVVLPSPLWSKDRTNFPWNIFINEFSCYTIQNGQKHEFLKPLSLNVTIGLSIKTSGENTSKLSSAMSMKATSSETEEYINNIGVCVHIDTTPILVSFTKTQVDLLVKVITALANVINTSIPSEVEILHKVVEDFNVDNQSSTGIFCTESSRESFNYISATTLHNHPESHDIEYDNIFTAWLQWTITKCSVELNSMDTSGKLIHDQNQLKLVIDMEDIVSSLDIQNVYLKLKNKVGSISIKHFKKVKETWEPGPYLGIVMNYRDDVTNEETYDNNAFLNLTVTRASCQHAHSMWENINNKKLDFKAGKVERKKFLTEIVISVKPIDFILPFKMLRSFYILLNPLIEFFPAKKNCKSGSNDNVYNWPLVYLDFYGMRIIMPVSRAKNKALHNVYILQVSKVILNPTAVNPICRTPYRPDIYQYGARKGLLNIPGNDFEDRQYQLDVFGISLCTNKWKNVKNILNEPSTYETKKAGCENPALEWNNLNLHQINSNYGSALTVIKKFDISVVFAPAMYYNKKLLVCCNSIELNIISDTLITLSLFQIKLALYLFGELNEIIDPIGINPAKSEVKNTESETSSDYVDIKRDSSINSPLEANSFWQSINTKKDFNYSPIEILFTGGEICFSLYTHSPLSSSTRNAADKDKMNKSKQDSVKKVESYIDMESYIPLFFVSFFQPNIYYFSQNNSDKLHFIIFNISIKTSNDLNTSIKSIPLQKDYSMSLIETLSGIPDPETGISSAFLTIKLIRIDSQNDSLNIEFGRPTKLYCSRESLLNILSVQNEILHYLKVDNIKAEANQTLKTKSLYLNKKEMEAYSKFTDMKSKFFNFIKFNVKTNQICLEWSTEDNRSVGLSIASLKYNLSFTNQPNKVNNHLSVNCLCISFNNNIESQLILKPWNVNMDCFHYWEPWQFLHDDPNIQFNLETDIMNVIVCPERIQILQIVIMEMNELFNNENCNEDVDEKNSSNTAFNRNLFKKRFPADMEQHYKDDLRTGVFQFIDSFGDPAEDTPLPYQVLFSSRDIAALTWKYPQPRCLTQILVYPVLLETLLNENHNTIVMCNIEYWSECHGKYLIYTTFQLPENEILELNLTTQNSYQPFAATWRIIINVDESTFSEQTKISSLFSSKMLAACLRVDSYFNQKCIPKITGSLEIIKFNVDFYFTIDKKQLDNAPTLLDGFECDMDIPLSHCFLTIYMDKTKLHLFLWDFKKYMFDINTTISVDVLDYTYLTMQPFVDSTVCKTKVSSDDNFNVSFIAETMSIYFGPAVTHTLSLGNSMWNQYLYKNIDGADISMFIFTRFIICNNSNVDIKFGQVDTDEEITLAPNKFHFYCWRSQKKKQFLKVALKDKEWLWSEPFNLYNNNELIQISTDLSINLSTVLLSPTQYQVIFSGQLIVANMLSDNFELKIIQEKEEHTKPINYVVTGNSISNSLIIDFKKKCFLRIRFYGLNSLWSGDIPLVEHAKNLQPWLVKVPLKQKSQFLSIWCRIVVQDSNSIKKMLIMLWPLYVIKSNLPSSVKLNIETPLLGYKGSTDVLGQGVIEQLYCPGTIDHSHQLKFQIENVTPSQNSYVPLNYSLINQEQLFNQVKPIDIDIILKDLKNFNQTKWPYLEDELNKLTWNIKQQLDTDVRVIFKKSGLHSCSVMVELIPWCLVINLLGCKIGFISASQEIFTLDHKEIISPPQFADHFNITVYLDNNCFWSDDFYLENMDNVSKNSNSSKTFVIPVQGIFYFNVKCGEYISRVLFQNSLENEIRLLKLCSSHVLCNQTSYKLRVLPICISKTEEGSFIPTIPFCNEIVLEPAINTNYQGIPICAWFNLKSYKINHLMDYSFYMIFSLSSDSDQRWSCPIKVDEAFNKKNICVSSSKEVVPLRLTSSKHNDQIYVSVYVDLCPQMIITNLCEFPIYCAENKPLDEGFSFKSHIFECNCLIESGHSSYFSTSSYNKNYPDLITSESSQEEIRFCINPNDSNCQWTQPVKITNDLEQFLQLSNYEEIKVVIQNTSCITIITLESIKKVEFCAKEIRTRLGNLSEVKKQTTEKKLSSISADELILQDFNLTLHPQDNENTESQKLEPNKYIPVRRWSDSVIVMSDKIQNNLELVTENYLTFGTIILINKFSITFLTDIDQSFGEFLEVALLTCDNLLISVEQSKIMEFDLTIQNIQFDNQLYSRKYYDFPVVLISQEIIASDSIFNIDAPLNNSIEEIKSPVLKINIRIQTWLSPSKQKIRGVQQILVTLQPLSFYVEDAFLMELVHYSKFFSPINLHSANPKKNEVDEYIYIPDIILWQGFVLEHPLRIQYLLINQISVKLSVHSSLKMYLALDRSPLTFAIFERRNVYTNPYRLGHVLTMHYLSGAIFRAGWMVSSLEILGSPAGLARAMGSGLKDFVGLPFQGLLQGPVEFLWGVTNGSASLMKHITAGTLHSVTKMAESVARNLDRLTLDTEHVKRVEEQRRQKPQGVTDGILQGLTGLGISILGAIGGIAHHPLQSIIANGGNPRSIAAGLGLGIVGVLTKPLSGAAELLALTGQGLLQEAGWNAVPEARSNSTQRHMFSSTNAILKYEWKIIHNVKLIYVIKGTLQAERYKPIAILITKKTISILDLDNDVIEYLFNFSDLEFSQCENDKSLLILKLKNKQNLLLCKDPTKNIFSSKERVLNYVKTFKECKELNNLNKETSSMEFSITSLSESDETNENVIVSIYLNHLDVNYIMCLIDILKQEILSNNYCFNILNQ